MIDIFSAEDGIFAVKLARRAVKTFIESQKQIEPPQEYPELFQNKGGVFVTLKTLEKKYEGVEKKLRGCIGFPYPTYPLIEAIIESAIASATRDSRFHPPFGPGAVKSQELSKIVFEVSLLTPPELIEVNQAKEYLEKIVIGRDGLIIEKGGHRGLLLPQVPVEYKWSVEEYLEHTCNKAFLPKDSWKMLDSKIFSFQAIIFEEIEPSREIKRKKIGDS